MRSFLALPLPEPMRASLLTAQARFDFGRPVPSEDLHLTLAFLGDAGPDALEVLHDLLEPARLPQPVLALKGLGTFAEMERGLVFAEVAAEPGLTALYEKATGAARRAGIDLPRRRFRPHVTLMRANRQPKGPARDRLAEAIGAPLSSPATPVSEMRLYRSDLTAQGPRYAVMASYPLGR